MMKSRWFICLLPALAFLPFMFGSCAPSQGAALKVAASTSLLSYIVQQVAGNNVDVVTIVPASQHPGDFDPKPGDIQKLAQAGLFLVHGFPGETYVKGMVAAANNPNLKVVTIDEGNASWMTPEVQLDATDKVAATLSQADPKNQSTYEKRAAQYRERVRAKETQVKSRLASAKMSSLVAISSVFQAPFATWAGIKVVGTYMTLDSAQAVQDLVDKGKASGANLVIDNVHSGRDAGKGLAEELSAKRVILVYFPGGLDNTETWEKAIDYDVGQLVNAAGTK